MYIRGEVFGILDAIIQAMNYNVYDKQKQSLTFSQHVNCLLWVSRTLWELISDSTTTYHYYIVQAKFLCGQQSFSQTFMQSTVNIVVAGILTKKANLIQISLCSNHADGTAMPYWDGT